MADEQPDKEKAQCGDGSREQKTAQHGGVVGLERGELLLGRDGRRAEQGQHRPLERGEHEEQDKRNGRADQRDAGCLARVFFPRLAEHVVEPEPGQDDERERGEEEYHRRAAELADARKEVVRDVIERRVAAPGHQQRAGKGAGEELDVAVFPAPEHGDEGEEQGQDAKILAVELERVLTPVGIKPARELRGHEVEGLDNRHRPGRGVLVAALAAARGKGHVAVDRQVLDCRQRAGKGNREQEVGAQLQGHATCLLSHD